jgi:RNA polymerase sigma factor (sigma-70 family)
VVYQVDKIELNKEQLAIIDEYCCDGMKKLKKLCNPIIMKIGGISEKDHDDIYSLAQFLLYKSVKNYDKDNANGASFKTFFYNILSRRIYATYIRDKNRQCRSNTRISKNGEVIFIPDVSLDAPTEETQDIKEKIASDYNVEDASEFDFTVDENVENFMSSLSNIQRKILEMKMKEIPTDKIRSELGISAARYAKEMESIKLNEGLLVFTKNRKEFIEEDMHMEERVMGISESEGYRMDKYSMFSLLDMKKTGDINCKYILQRKPFQWSNEERNRYICRILSNLPIPEIILCEQNVKGMTISHLIDGLQRLSYAEAFKENHFKVGETGAERHFIQYREYIHDENGNRVLDEDGIPEFELKVCDIVGKSYKDLPDELKKRFNNFNINVTKFFNCTNEQIADHIRDYNNHSAMNNEQSGIVSISTDTARKIKTITEKCGFLKNCGKYTTTNRIKGKLDRMVAEMIMLLFHPNDWKSNVKATYKYLDENAKQEEFDTLSSELDMLESVIENAGDDINAMFTTTYTPMWVAVFHNFLTSGKDLHNFVDFLNAYNSELKDTEVNGVSMADFKDQQSKKKATITGKVDLLIQLMNDYLHINTTETENDNTELSDDTILNFVKENYKPDANEDDISFYSDLVDDCVKIDEPVYKECHAALITLMAYACSQDKDQDFEKWIDNYKTKSDFSPSQKTNFTYMKRSFDNYLNV